MLIDLANSENETLFRYESDHVPMIGETISTFKPDKKTFIVNGVDSLVKPRALRAEINCLDLITLSVEEI